jgi:hypothetical protein
MTSNIISRAACLAETNSNPKSFFNCPDLHGGCDSPRSAELSQVEESETDLNAAEEKTESDLNERSLASTYSLSVI